MDFIEELNERPEGSLDVTCHVLSDNSAQQLEDYLVDRLASCYISQEKLEERANQTGLTYSELIANKIPDKGSVMSGDFGEIFTLYFLDRQYEDDLKLIKKWRYKQDRKKAAPHSDVVLFNIEDLNNPSEDDFVICAESKQKATSSTFDPIASAISGYESDRTGRLAKTLVWLKEKAIDEGNQDDLALASRFADELNTRYSKIYRAVAVVDRTFLNNEITKNINLPERTHDFEIIVIGIDDLKERYESVYQRACAEADL
ncbi:DUF1837 domain-containing protein [Aestuariicella hydrocarbonica]|uniref:DUF1837 domain-containing protein n=1 Tax=Pseudomaricurvus hydrocarbonicus TaxID=1470433 RepID=A0A9E5MK54_9GAMM|nr:DUF1837 domain-containing protein [Aestuariicella hydrocarbonica]NHO66039.1 DUF1837 domain-containing protein [Aestuariicella hydrocarbonica]